MRGVQSVIVLQSMCEMQQVLWEGSGLPRMPCSFGSMRNRRSQTLTIIGSAFKELRPYVVEINDVEVEALAVGVVGQGMGRGRKQQGMNG